MIQARSISKSMVSYLKRARESKEFLLKETKEFERGKRHLANIMGIESQEMTQDHIDDAIDYLFPSGLFDKRARPMMKHPDLLFKAQKDAQFDIEGRPHHYLFYTTRPNYHESLSKLGKIIKELNLHEDEQIANGYLDPPEDAQYDFSGREWLDRTQICDKFLEPITDAEYEFLIKSLVQLTKHPYAIRAKAYIEEHSKELPGQSLNLDLPELLGDEKTGHIYTEMAVRRREHRVKVKTVLNGSGIFRVDDQDILFFEAPHHRRAILSPLQLTDMIDKVDIFAQVTMYPEVSGPSAVAACIRLAVARSIAAYTDAESRERLRLAGMLTHDMRVKERKKFGQEGARRKYTWKKR